MATCSWEGLELSQQLVTALVGCFSVDSDCVYHQYCAGEPRSLHHFNVTNTCQFNCSTGFYCSGGVVCLPSCDWKEITEDSSNLTDALVRLLVAVGVIVGILVLVISCIRRKRM